jgi:hypothetical protein
MRCESCGTENPSGQRFCGHCGAALALTGPATGKRSSSASPTRTSSSRDGTFVTAVDAAYAMGDLADVDELLATVRSLPPGRRTPFLEAHASRLGARLSAARGSGGDVASAFKGSVGLFREMGIPFWMAVTLLEYAEWLVGQGRVDEATPSLTEAREIFERLGARPWLERLQRVDERETATP